MRRLPGPCLGLALVLLSAPVVAQSADTSFTLPRNAVLDITLRSGELIVRGTDRSTAELRADDQRYQVRASGVGVTIAPLDDRGRLRNDERSNGNGALELTVPRGVRVVVTAGSADVEVYDISGDVEVHSLSGDITLRAIGGRAIVETLSGDVRLSEGAEGARVTTVSGDITLRGVRGSADIHTTSGNVSLGVVRATQVQAESMSGDVMLDGDLTDNARVQVTTHSGDVTLRMPESARGVMEMSTFNGDFSASRPLTMMSSATGSRGTGERGTQRYEFGGGGAARLTVTTFNGDIRVLRSTARDPE